MLRAPPLGSRDAPRAHPSLLLLHFPCLSLPGWHSVEDDPQLLRLCVPYPTGAPQSTKEWKKVADAMWPGCQPAQCKSALKRLLLRFKIQRRPDLYKGLARSGVLHLLHTLSRYIGAFAP